MDSEVDRVRRDLTVEPQFVDAAAPSSATAENEFPRTQRFICSRRSNLRQPSRRKLLHQHVYGSRRVGGNLRQ